MAVVRIGTCTLDTSDGTLAGASSVTRLEPKVQAVLLQLVEHAGAVVSREDLLRGVWIDTHVEPGALSRTISILRHALGDEVRRPRYIETVPKRGYRLIAPVEHIDAAGQPDSPPAEPAVARRRGRYVAVAAAAIGLALWAPARPLRHDMPTSMWETQLWHDTRLGNEILFERYSRLVATEAACPEAQAGLATVLAFRANYLPDRTRWVNAAIEAARRAAELDPSSAAAERALGIAYAQAGRLKDAASHFSRALAIDPDDAATRTNLGLMLMASGQVARSLAAFEGHVAVQPASADGYARLAGGLVVSGHLREAADAARAAIERRPHDLTAQLVLVKVDLLGGQLGAARARLTRLLEIHPDCVQCVVQLGVVEEMTGRDAAATDRYREARAMAAQFAPAASLRLALVWRRAGRTADAEALLEQVEKEAGAAIERGDETAWPRWQLAAASAVRGDRLAAVGHYRQAVAAGRRDAAWDRWDPLLSSIQSDPAFVALLSAADTEHAAAAPVAARIRAALE